MFPGEIPGRSRLALLGRRSATGGSSEEVDCHPVTKVILFHNGCRRYTADRCPTKLEKIKNSSHV